MARMWLAIWCGVCGAHRHRSVEQRHRHVLAYTREADDAWVRAEFRAAGKVPIVALETTLARDDIHADVRVPPRSVGDADDEGWEAHSAGFDSGA